MEIRSYYVFFYNMLKKYTLHENYTVFARTEQITCNFLKEWLSKLVYKRHIKKFEDLINK